jgi:UrcA family protein
MTISTRSIAAFSACALLGLASVAPATAASPAGSEVVAKVVRFKDLDIATAPGAEALYGRIVSAARYVCRAEAYTLADDCRARAVAGAVRGVSSTLLTSIHRSLTEKVEEVVTR